MPNYNQLIYTSADYKIILSFNSIPYPLFTLNSFDENIKVEDETIYAIGEIDPIGEKYNGRQYSGKLELQAGEVNAILIANGFADITQIRGAKISITSLDGLITRTYSGVNFIGSDFSIKAKDKDSRVSVNWKAVGLK